MGYEGHLMMVSGRAERQAAVEQSMALLRQAHADVGGEIVSAGGTGTYDMHGDTGVTEVQAGSYALMDTHYGTLGLPFEQALHVLGTVISVCADWAVADVGLKALGMDHGNPSIVGGEVWFCSDEHVTFSPTAPVAVGDRVRVVPAHIDPTMAMHEAAWITSGDEVDRPLADRPPRLVTLSSPLSAASRLRNARPRWDTAFFSASVISANVRPSPSSGTNTAS